MAKPTCYQTKESVQRYCFTRHQLNELFEEFASLEQLPSHVSLCFIEDKELENYCLFLSRKKGNEKEQFEEYCSIHYDDDFVSAKDFRDYLQERINQTEKHPIDNLKVIPYQPNFKKEILFEATIKN